MMISNITFALGLFSTPLSISLTASELWSFEFKSFITYKLDLWGVVCVFAY